MEKQHEESTRFETILARLVARNTQLDRQLAAFCKQHDLSPEALAAAASLAKRYPPGQLARVQQQLEARLDDDADANARRSWEQVSRPSLEQLSRRFGQRLVRV